MQRARGGHWLPQEWQARRASMRRGRAALGQHLERLTEAYLAGVVPLAEYGRRRREADVRLLAPERQEQDLLHDIGRQDETAQLAAHAEAFCRRVREGLAEAAFERKRALLELLVDRVVVTDGAVEIRYVVPTGPEGEHAPFSRLRTDSRELAAPRQRRAPARLARLPAAGAGGDPAHLRGLACGATPAGVANHTNRGAPANTELTFVADHPMGADQQS